MGGSPYFSVVIPTYNRADLLRRCLGSVLSQAFPDFEVLVCDDGSTDHTPQVVEEFQGRMELRHMWEPNWGGPARPRNIGIRHARGEWVCFLDSDDWWSPEKLAEVRKRTPDADVVYHDLEIATPSGMRRAWVRSRPVRKPVFVSLLTRDSAICTSGLAVRRSVLEKAGPVSEDRDLVSVEDFELLLRIARVTERFVRIPALLGAYWKGEGNISAFSERQIRTKEYLFGQYFGFLGEEERRRSRALLRYYTGFIKYTLGRYREAREDLWAGTDSCDMRVKAVCSLLLLLSLVRR